MSDRPIQVGDLVMVVHPDICCMADRAIGKIYRATAVAPGYQCGACGHIHYEASFVLDGKWGEPARRLKRIPPLSELDSIPEREEIPA